MGELQALEYRIEGLTALLLHNPAGSMVPSDAGAKRGKNIPTPEEEAERATYRLEDGTLAIPSIAFRNCVIGASKSYRVGRSSLRTAVAHIQAEPELLALRTLKGETIAEYEIDIRRAVVQRNAILRARPKFFPWSTTVRLLYDEELLPEDAFKLFGKLLNDGGSRLGVGDYRPERNGWFGRFKVTL